MLPVGEGACVIWPPALPVMWGSMLESNYMFDGRLCMCVEVVYLREHCDQML